MTPDPREEAIRAAYDAARFDERTPDERGFAERFEGFKPSLKENVPFNMRLAAARRRRRRFFIGMCIVVAIAAVPLSVALNVLKEQEATRLFIAMTVCAVIGLYLSRLMKPVRDEDPNHAAVIDAVLKQFGCRVARTSTMERLMPASSPIRPQWSRIQVLDEHVAGRFDDHLPFVALRVKTTEHQGKSTTETFKGWYLRVELPFSFSGTTAIREYLAPSYRFGSRVDTRTMTQVGLEDPEFARRFYVSSSDQVEARMILAPDVMEHLKKEADRLEPEGKGWNPSGDLMLGFTENRAHIWLPSRATALSDWRPLDPPTLVEDLHEAFAELAQIRAFLRDIDVIAESEGFRAQAARNGRTP